LPPDCAKNTMQPSMSADRARPGREAAKPQRNQRNDCLVSFVPSRLGVEGVKVSL
jgi:hypothetical protein